MTDLSGLVCPGILALAFAVLFSALLTPDARFRNDDWTTPKKQPRDRHE